MARKAKGLESKPVRRPLTRLEREARMARAVNVGIVVVIISLVGVLGYGLLYETVIKGRQPVAIVDGVPITVAEYRARFRYEMQKLLDQKARWIEAQAYVDPNSEGATYSLNTIASNLNNINLRLRLLDAQVYEDLIRSELVRHEAERRGITVSQEEMQEGIDYELALFRVYSGLVTPEPLPTPLASPPLTSTAEATGDAGGIAPVYPTSTPMSAESRDRLYDLFVRKYLRPLGVSEAMLYSWVEESRMAKLLQARMGEEQIPTVDDQVLVRYITVFEREKAWRLVERLESGEDFQSLMDEVTEEGTSVGYASELEGWYPRVALERVLGANLGMELVDIAFSLDAGEYTTEPVPTTDGTRYTILQVTGHEVRPVEAERYQTLLNWMFQDWLDGQEYLVQRLEYQQFVPPTPEIE